MNKLIITLIIAVLLAVLTACNTAEPTPKESKDIKEPSSNEEKNSAGDSWEESLDKEVGEKFSDEFTVAQKANLKGQETKKQSGPINVSLSHVYVVKSDVDITRDIKKNEYFLAIYLSAENTSNDSVAFDISSGAIPDSQNKLIMDEGVEVNQVYISDYVDTHFSKKRQVNVIIWFPIPDYNEKLKQANIIINYPYRLANYSGEWEELPKSLLESLGESEKLGENMKFGIDF
ncbi:hypothetical protein [Virgibacillus ndiopensis]|uniref:hypothetical protein n=1 Tax=Virgibacillus ndiopensis TaxID=2004408 RepID=UPI000C075553|nr:hypothetical protein [Virgibacillus ndiopensis]